MKNIEEKILMVDEEIKQLQNKRKKLTSQQKQEERKQRDKRIYEKGAVFENSFTESMNLIKDEFYQLIISLIRKEEADKNHREKRRNKSRNYRKPRGRNGHRIIVSCLQRRTYTP